MRVSNDTLLLFYHQRDNRGDYSVTPNKKTSFKQSLISLINVAKIVLTHHLKQFIFITNGVFSSLNP